MKVVYTEDTEHTCGKCMECETACQLGLNPVAGKIYPLCHNCGDCIATCEKIKTKGKPLSFRF
jgi:polyferredoxin